MRLVELGLMSASIWVDTRLGQTRVFTFPKSRWLGQSTVEYALVGALVVIAAAGALTVLGTEITTVFTRIKDTLSTAAVSAGH